MASEATICNQALQLTKNGKVITGLDQGTKEANACEEVYEDLRDYLLELHTWNFSVKRKKLGQLAASEAPAFNWDHAYEMPSDFLRAVGVYDNSEGRGSIPYAIENGTFVSDADELYLVYVARIVDPNLMSAGFRQCLAVLLASRLAVALANNAKLADALHQQFTDQYLPTATGADSIQDYPDERPESSWNTVRYGDTRTYTPGDPPD